MAAPNAFLVPAEEALGHAIEVVSGREEARLIYLGVAHGLPESPEKREKSHRCRTARASPAWPANPRVVCDAGAVEKKPSESARRYSDTVA
jgi:hypothetical protein